MSDAAGMGTWTQAVHNYLTGAASSRFRSQEVVITDHWRGRDNLLWRVRCGERTDAVVKMFTDAGQARSRRQFSGQEQFAPAGLAPEPLWYDRYPHGLPRQILVYRWADGVLLAPSDRLHRSAHAAAAARVHSASRDEVQRFSPHPFNLLTFWQIWQAGEAPLRAWVTAAPAPLLTEHLSSLWAAAHRLMDTVLPLLGETPPSPIHGDLRAENALIHRGQARLVDWEFFGLGDPAQEIGRFLFLGGDDWTKEGQEEWQDIYYCGNTDPGLPDRVDIYVRLFSSQAVTYLLEGIRQKAVPPVSDAGPDAESTQVQSFLISALIAAVRHSQSLWGLSPLSDGDSYFLKKEIGYLTSGRLPAS